LFDFVFAQIQLMKAVKSGVDTPMRLPIVIYAAQY
jgi:hypothetical protein